MKPIFTMLLLAASFFCQAQQAAVKTVFLKDNGLASNFFGIRVFDKDSADYIRTIATEKNNENLYDVTEYYLDNSPRRIANSLTSSLFPRYNGKVITYFKNGNIAAEELFVNGRLKGISNYYFANKQLRKSANFEIEKNKSVEVVLALNDSTGTQFLDKDGTGTFKTVDENGNALQGTYTKGLKDKTWKTVDQKKSETYLDEYKAGEYVKGKTIDAQGNETEYDGLESLPTFKGGSQAFGSFLAANLRYPSDARDNNVQGRVFLQFVIEKDGSLVEAKVLRGIGHGCDEEALRVINKSPNWNPGMQRGKAVRVSYTVPIFFQLAGGSLKSETRKPFGGYNPSK
ncbi:MAG TPA: TonB family protein [Pelobium sp.]